MQLSSWLYSSPAKVTLSEHFGTVGNSVFLFIPSGCVGLNWKISLRHNSTRFWERVWEITPEIRDFVCVGVRVCVWVRACVCLIIFNLEFCDFRNVKIKNHFFLIWKDINIWTLRICSLSPSPCWFWGTLTVREPCPSEAQHGSF